MKFDYVGIAPCGHVRQIFVADMDTPDDVRFVSRCLQECAKAGLRVERWERDKAVEGSLAGLDCTCGQQARLPMEVTDER